MQQKIKEAKLVPDLKLKVMKDGYVYLPAEAETFLRKSLIGRLADVNSRWKAYKFVAEDGAVITLDDVSPSDFPPGTKAGCYDFQRRSCIRAYVADLWKAGTTIYAYYEPEKGRIFLKK